VKCWLWEFDAAFQDKDSKIIDRTDEKTGQTFQWDRDFHLVCAPVSCENGKELKNCYCKNGKRPATGPVLASTQKPADKEVATTSASPPVPIKDANGDPIYRVRRNFDQSCYCRPPATN
jgi:hypothetical protein